MTELVSVDEHIFDKQGVKYVFGTHGMLTIPAGEVAPTDQGEVVRDDWEPKFEFRLAQPVHADEDVPDCVGLAIRDAVQRIYGRAPDGSDHPDGPWGWDNVEWAYGPYVQDGSLMLWLDTDGDNCPREEIEAMARLFAEHLTPCGVPVRILAGTVHCDDLDAWWRSSAERDPQ